MNSANVQEKKLIARNLTFSSTQLVCFSQEFIAQNRKT